MSSLSMIGGTGIDLGMSAASSQTAPPNGVAGTVNAPQDTGNIAPSQGNISPGTPSQTSDLGGGSPGAVADSRGSVSPASSPSGSGSSPAAAAASVETGSGATVSFNA
ncbi:MAG: hypothetical protein HZA01_03375 [Nitrospinae bacterium]|nr:hypothetical protein [Nitrospinota bacterium]